jgi:hypothetical protein
MSSEQGRNVTVSAGAFSYSYRAPPLSAASSLPSRILLPNSASITNAYDSLARLNGTYLKNSGGTVLDSYVYAYDPANERTNLTRFDGSTVAFSCDRIGQLTGADSSLDAEDRGYFYDATWNLHPVRCFA